METQALAALSKVVLTPNNLMIMVAAWFLIAMSRKVFPAFYLKPAVVRMLPMFPMLLCMALICIPGLSPKGTTLGWNLVLGIVLGWGVGHLHKVLKQTVLGKSTFLDAQAAAAAALPKEPGKVEETSPEQK